MPEQLELLRVAEPVTTGPEVNRLHVRESTRARRMFLHVKPPIGIELVVPRGTRAKTVQSFVEAHRKWIEDAWAQIDQEYVGDRSARPERIELRSLRRQFSVSYSHAPASRRRCLTSADTVYVRTREADFSDAPQLLRDWLLRQARRTLPARVFEEAKRVGQSPKRVQVRLQRTRWGSCSAHGTISVNAALLFLAPELERYLIIHELCHMQHMNHSRAYWRHVAQFEPEYRRLDAELSRSWQQLPWWVMAD